MDPVAVVGAALLAAGGLGAAFNTFYLTRLPGRTPTRDLIFSLMYVTDMALALVGLAIIALPQAREVVANVFG